MAKYKGLIVPYLDMPLQHGERRVLKRMLRPHNMPRQAQFFAQLRAAIPEVVLRTTFIVGFPGETEEDFLQLLNFLDEAQLDRVGCFTYSPVEGAPANELADQVPEDINQIIFCGMKSPVSSPLFSTVHFFILLSDFSAKRGQIT
mgnify:CR=1 FL=1